MSKQPIWPLWVKDMKPFSKMHSKKSVTLININGALISIFVELEYIWLHSCHTSTIYIYIPHTPPLSVFEYLHLSEKIDYFEYHLCKVAHSTCQSMYTPSTVPTKCPAFASFIGFQPFLAWLSNTQEPRSHPIWCSPVHRDPVLNNTGFILVLRSLMRMLPTTDLTNLPLQLLLSTHLQFSLSIQPGPPQHPLMERTRCRSFMY